MMNSGFKKYFSNTAWLVGGRMVKAIINFVVAIFVARYLGPERFGALSYAIGLALFFSIFCAMGLDSILTRELVGASTEKRNTLMGSAFGIRLGGACVAFLLTLLLLYFSNADRETWTLTLLCTLSYLFMTTEVFRGFYEAMVQGRMIVVVEIIQSLLSAALRLYFVVVKGDIFWFAVCWLSEWAFVSVGFAVLYRYKFGRFSQWEVNISKVRFLLRESLPLLLSAMAIVVYQQVDKIMLKNMLGESGNEQVGYYSAALRVLPFVFLIPQMLGKSLVPSLVNAHAHSLEKYKARSQMFMDLMVASGTVLSIMLFFSADYIVSLYGQEYVLAGILLKIISCKGFFVALQVASGHLIIVQGVQRWAVVRNLSGVIVNIALNFFWIPTWGAMGSAYATVISFAVASFLINMFIPAYRDIFRIQYRSIFNGWVRLLGRMYQR